MRLVCKPLHQVLCKVPQEPLRVSAEWVDQGPAQSHRTPGLKLLEVPPMGNSIISKEGTPTMITTDIARLSFLQESLLRLQRQWTLKN